MIWAVRLFFLGMYVTFLYMSNDDPCRNWWNGVDTCESQVVQVCDTLTATCQ